MRQVVSFFVPSGSGSRALALLRGCSILVQRAWDKRRCNP
jgi:hypothetical protein